MCKNRKKNPHEGTSIIALIGKVRSDGKKGGPERGQKGKKEESSSSNHGKKDLNHV